MAGAEKKKRGGLSRVCGFVVVVGVFWYSGEREFCGESAGKKVGFVGSVVYPFVVSRFEWRYVESWWLVVEELTVNFPPFL